MELIPELAGSVPGGMQSAFWTIEALINGFALIKFQQWWQKN